MRGRDRDLEKRAQEIVRQIGLLYSELLDILGRSHRLGDVEVLAWREYIERHVRNLASWVRAVLTDEGLEPGEPGGPDGEECCEKCMKELYLGDYESCTYICGYPCYEPVD